jgi:hypothetical protein
MDEQSHKYARHHGIRLVWALAELEHLEPGCLECALKDQKTLLGMHMW